MGSTFSGGQTAAQLAKAGKYGQIGIKAAASYTAGFAANKIAGLDASFSWRGMAASVGTSIASSAISSGLNLDTDNFASNFANGVISAGVNHEIRKGFGLTQGNLDWGRAAVDAFGNAVGNALVEKAVGGEFLGPKFGEKSVRQLIVEKSLMKPLIKRDKVDEVYMELLKDFDPEVTRENLLEALKAGKPMLLASNGDTRGIFAGFYDEFEEFTDNTIEYLTYLKDGAAEKANEFWNNIVASNPELARNIDVAVASLPSLVEGIKAEVGAQLPGLLIDTAIALAGVLLAPVSAGASTTASIIASVRRIDKLAHMAVGIADTVNSARHLVENFDDYIENAKTLARGETDRIMGEFSDDVGRALPGIENSKIQSAIGNAIDTANEAITAVSEAFAKGKNGPNKLRAAIGDTIKRHGEVGEKVAAAVLTASGLFETGNIPGSDVSIIGPIQNKSNHGIDFVAKAKTGNHFGKFVGFELKAGLLKNAPGLQGDQRRGANSFMRSRVQRAIDGNGHWRSAPQGTSEFARFVKSNNLNRYEGYVISINKMAISGRNGRNVVFSPWR